MLTSAPPSPPSRADLLADTARTRSRALNVLTDLQHAQEECDSHLKAFRRPDALKAVTGRSALETAIGATRRMIDTLDRIIDESRPTLSDSERQLLADLNRDREPTRAPQA